MRKFQVLIFILISTLMLIVEARSISHKRVKTAEFRVYIQEWLSGPYATTHEVARADITSTSSTSTSFGRVLVSDSIMTIGADQNSEKLGRVQGLLAYSGLEEAAVTMNFNFLFTGGKYKGSTLGVSGWKLTSNLNQELPIVGGTGVFRGARGYVVGNTHSYDPTTDHVVLIYDIHVLPY